MAANSITALDLGSGPDAGIQSSLTGRARSIREFDEPDALNDALSKDSKVDKGRLLLAFDAVSQARASMQKANAQMLLDIRRELDPDQIDKLEKLQ
jgi:hypothetical protein